MSYDKKHKRLLSFVLTIVLLFISTGVVVPSASALTGTINKTASVYMSPYNTSEHIVDSISANTVVTVIDRELDFLYIYYNVGTVRKSEYVKLSDINASGYTYHNYTHYESAINNTLSSQSVYYCPDGKDQCDSIDSNEGEIYNKPLTVLRQENGYSFVQYVINPQNNGSSNVIFRRGWVNSDVLTIEPKTSAVTSPSSATKYYIKNVATGLYLDVSGYTTADGTRIQLWDFHGGYNQEFILQPITTAHGSTYVRLLTNMTSSNNKAVRVATGVAIMNSNVDLHTVSNLRSQEFYFQPTLDGHYYIRSRCGQNYMMLGVDPSNSTTGCNVLLRYPAGTLYEKWDIVPVYQEYADYNYWKSGVPSTMNNGIQTTFDISDIVVTDSSGTYGNSAFTQYTINAFNAWSTGNRGFNLTSNPNSQNLIVFSAENKRSEYDEPIYGQTIPFVYANNTSKMAYCEIIIYYSSILHDFGINKVDEVWMNVLAHELGHAMGLGDMDVNTNNPVVPHSIMSYGRDRTSTAIPHNCDVAGVKKNYMTQMS